jgi:hypothetical protein
LVISNNWHRYQRANTSMPNSRTLSTSVGPILLKQCEPVAITNV